MAWEVASNDESVCTIVSVIFICPIMPTLLLFCATNCQVPEKLLGFWASAVVAIKHSTVIKHLLFMIPPCLVNPCLANPSADSVLPRTRPHARHLLPEATERPACPSTVPRGG